ncbi:Putative anti-sigma factor antagonist [Roseivivax jejudonensis]|uniref:Anti-sigma factor antagonist n=1 Tax=Roseivivax jejudonensis TaxID=1529041 RepID=A0A1X6ZRJ2_9RHOB|nr:STAS domain-containing protein [Roseivivax jejudonensis]SLN59187.1 Putative anti-sigma factor antagonist [Roseivivax jejudonensis]
MLLSTESLAGALIVRVDATRIDAASAIQFKDAMREASSGPETRILLDLSRVEFVDSSGLGAVVAAMKHLGPGRRLDLVALQPNVDKVFRLTRMDTIFAIHADIAAASIAHAGG